jgi:hypothetical protein
VAEFKHNKDESLAGIATLAILTCSFVRILTLDNRKVTRLFALHLGMRGALARGNEQHATAPPIQIIARHLNPATLGT